MDTNSARPLSHQWIWIASIWSGFALVDAMDTVLVMRGEGMHHAWTKLFCDDGPLMAPVGLGDSVGVAARPPVPSGDAEPLTTWLVHVAACATIGLIFAVWTTWLEFAFNPYARPSYPGTFAYLWFDKFYNGILTFLVLYAAIVTVSYVLDSKSAWPVNGLRLRD